MSAPLLVPDSGPLIALARADLLRLPALLYSQVLVPVAVWGEVLRQPPDDERTRLHAALESGHLNVPNSQEAPAAPLTDPRLGRGERAAIGLALTRGADVLIDERRGRQAALDAGLHVVGTLGLLARGRELRLIGPVRPTIETLRTSGYFLSEALTRRLLAQLGE